MIKAKDLFCFRTYLYMLIAMLIVFVMFLAACITGIVFHIVPTVIVFGVAAAVVFIIALIAAVKLASLNKVVSSPYTVIDCDIERMEFRFPLIRAIVQIDGKDRVCTPGMSNYGQWFLLKKGTKNRRCLVQGDKCYLLK